MHILQRFRTLIRDEQGLATVEYAVLLSGLIVGAGAIWQVLTSALTTPAEQAGQSISPN
jgi:Flp pilus assembly pilin Flp